MNAGNIQNFVMANEGIVLKIGNEALDQITTFKIVFFFMFLQTQN